MKRLIENPIEHIGFVVLDIDQTVNYFERVFGIQNFTVYEFSPNKCWSRGERMEGYKLKIAMAEAQDKKSTGIEIIQPLLSEGIHYEMATKWKKGINHFAFRVDDYDFYYKSFRDQNYEFIFESETEDRINGYRRCFYIFDRIQNLVYEIKEKAEVTK